MASSDKKEIDRLERRHRKLKERVAQYESRLYLSPNEERELMDMKKEKLATKDMIAMLDQS